MDKPKKQRKPYTRTIKRQIWEQGGVLYVPSQFEDKIGMVDPCDRRVVEGYNWTAMPHKSSDGNVLWYLMRRRLVGEDGPVFLKLHNLIMGPPPEGMMIDHKFGNGLDNRREFLRFLTRSENAINSHKARSAGVEQTPGGRWRARLMVNQTPLVIAICETREEALAARNAAIDFYFPGVVLAKPVPITHMDVSCVPNQFLPVSVTADNLSL